MKWFDDHAEVVCPGPGKWILRWQRAASQLGIEGKFQSPNIFPVLLAARMSLSFPSAIRCGTVVGDRLSASPERNRDFQRCLFSRRRANLVEFSDASLSMVLVPHWPDLWD